APARIEAVSDEAAEVRSCAPELLAIEDRPLVQHAVRQRDTALASGKFAARPQRRDESCEVRVAHLLRRGAPDWLHYFGIRRRARCRHSRESGNPSDAEELPVLIVSKDR